MSLNWVLDLFSGAGGATKGYQDAGFFVVGVDNEPQPNYCGDRFIQADAVGLLTRLLEGEEVEGWRLEDFAVVHASTPCQAYAEVANSRKLSSHPELLEPMRQLFLRSQERGIFWVSENVPPAPMPNSFVLCGSSFSLPIIRHRRFETFPALSAPPAPRCPQKRYDRAVTHGPGFYPYGRKNWGPAWREHVLPVVWPWMTMKEAGQAVPPAYTAYIGERLMNRLFLQDAVAA